MERFETKAFGDYKYAKLIYNLDTVFVVQHNVISSVLVYAYTSCFTRLTKISISFLQSSSDHSCIIT